MYLWDPKTGNTPRLIKNKQVWNNYMNPCTRGKAETEDSHVLLNDLNDSHQYEQAFRIRVIHRGSFNTSSWNKQLNDAREKERVNNFRVAFGEERERVKKKGPDNIANNKKLHVVVC